MQSFKIKKRTTQKTPLNTKTKSVLNVLIKQIYKSRYSATNSHVDEPQNQWTKCTQKRKNALLSTLFKGEKPMILKDHHKELAIKVDAKFMTPKQINPQKTKSIHNIHTNEIFKQYTHATNPYVH